jgi:hypothetical protein
LKSTGRETGVLSVVEWVGVEVSNQQSAIRAGEKESRKWPGCLSCLPGSSLVGWAGAGRGGRAPCRKPVLPPSQLRAPIPAETVRMAMDTVCRILCAVPLVSPSTLSVPLPRAVQNGEGITYTRLYRAIKTPKIALASRADGLSGKLHEDAACTR